MRERKHSVGGTGAAPPPLTARAALPAGAWRDPAAYAGLALCGPRGLAWELLRRDADYALAARRAAARAGGIWPVVASAGLATRWGLHALEDPDRSAVDARLFWTAAADPTILSASAIEPLGWFDALGVSLSSIVPAAVGRVRQAVALGGTAHGIRIDVADRAEGEARLLGFHLTLARPLAVQLAELARLWSLWNGAPLADPVFARDMARSILLLRAIDALAEGASLRMVGAGLVSADEWPGDSEWAKSRARRIIVAARALWTGGPAAVLNAMMGAAPGGVSKCHSELATPPIGAGDDYVSGDVLNRLEQGDV